MKKVRINLKSTQTDGVQSNSDLNTYIGTIEHTDRQIILSYTESKDFAGGVKTQIIVENADRVLIKRTGSVNSVMIIEKGRRHTHLYPTQYGDIEMRFYGKSIESNINQNGVQLVMKYEISSGSQSVSDNTIEISAEEMQN